MEQGKKDQEHNLILCKHCSAKIKTSTTTINRKVEHCGGEPEQAASYYGYMHMNRLLYYYSETVTPLVEIEHNTTSVWYDSMLFLLNEKAAEYIELSSTVVFFFFLDRNVVMLLFYI